MITFRPHTKNDILYRIKWLNNPKVTKYIWDAIGKKTTIKEQTERFINYHKDKNKKFFTICDEKKPIGLIGISNINKNDKNANLFIMIGEDEYRGKGIGKTAMKRLIDYGFKTLKLYKLKLYVLKENIPAVKLYQSLGFITEGDMKDEVFFKGKFYDLLRMALFQQK